MEQHIMTTLKVETTNRSAISMTQEQIETAIREYVARNAPGYSAKGVRLMGAHMMNPKYHAVVEVQDDLAQYSSPCPAGYDTVLGWCAKNHPGMLEFMDTDPEATVRDGFWLTHRAKERGLKIVKVLAPEVLRKQGRHIEMINAYPVELLAERLG